MGLPSPWLVCNSCNEHRNEMKFFFDNIYPMYVYDNILYIQKKKRCRGHGLVQFLLTRSFKSLNPISLCIKIKEQLEITTYVYISQLYCTSRQKITCTNLVLCISTNLYMYTKYRIHQVGTRSSNGGGC